MTLQSGCLHLSQCLLLLPVCKARQFVSVGTCFSRVQDRQLVNQAQSQRLLRRLVFGSEVLVNVPRAWLGVPLTRRGDPCKFGLSSPNIIAAATNAKTRSQAVPILQVVDGGLV